MRVTATLDLISKTSSAALLSSIFAPSREITFSFFPYSFYETNGNATEAKKERARCTKVP
jgi:hypothetical protein